MEPTNNQGGDQNQAMPQAPMGAPQPQADVTAPAAPANEMPAGQAPVLNEVPQPQADVTAPAQVAPVVTPPTGDVAPAPAQVGSMAMQDSSTPVPTSEPAQDAGLGGPAAPAGGPEVPHIEPQPEPEQSGDQGGQQAA